MRIYGKFKDIYDNTIRVTIYNINKTGSDINIDTSDWIRFSGDEPVTISTDCDDSFTHLIKKTCKINLLTKRWMGEYLFANNATSIVVNINRTINNVTTCLFAGYVVPCTYNQDYAREWEKITINCIDNLGVLEYRQQTDEHTWDELKAASQMRTFKYLIDLMHLRDTTYIISNLPQQQYDTQTIWVETGFERVTDADNTVTYYIVESEAHELDSDTAVTTTKKRVGDTPLTVTYIQSEEIAIHDGLPYYKQYAYVTVNGELVNTGDWIYGDLATAAMPTVVDTVNVLDGWTYGAILQPFEYYEHFRVDKEMSDGSIARGETDTIGDRIPEYPQTTTLGSYYEFRQSNELYRDPDNGRYYYKKYAWIVMEIDNETVEYKTGDYNTAQMTTNGQICGYMKSGTADAPMLGYYTTSHRPDLDPLPMVADIYDTTTYYYEFNTIPNDATTVMLCYSYRGDNHSTTDWVQNDYESIAIDPSLNANDITLKFYQFTNVPGWSTTPGAHDSYLYIIDGLDNLDTSLYTSMQSMFSSCCYVNYLDVSGFNTSNVTDMSQMFARCQDLTYLDVSNFDTSNVTSMNSMFASCKNLTYLDVSNFDTSHVGTGAFGAGMDAMFDNCKSLSSIDVSNFDTSNVKSMGNMFFMCESLSSIDVSNFDTRNVTSMWGMFAGCKSLSSIDVSNFSTSNVTNMARMFDGCTSLTSLDISTFDTSNVRDMYGLISNCPNLTTVNISNLNTSKRGNSSMSSWFANCNALTSLIMNNTSDDTFAYITNETRLNHNCTIYRDNVTYVYSADDETWIPQI